MSALYGLIRTTDRIFGASLADRLGKRKRSQRIRRQWSGLKLEFPIPIGVENEILNILSEISFYWTPPEKQLILASLILEKKLKTAVEIGVYTGGSFLPQVVALKHNDGHAIGIDPFSDAEAEQNDNREIIDNVDPELLRPDREKMYNDLLALIDRFGLSQYCEILRLTSNNACNQVEEEIDLLHIDGNHDYNSVANDLMNYMPKIRVGGYLFMDDINWGTIAPLYSNVRGQMECVYETTTWGCCRKTAGNIKLPTNINSPAKD